MYIQNFVFFFCLAILMLQNKISSSSVPGKQCVRAHECWGTEPMDSMGLPLSINSRVSKRLIIGANSKGVKCRCRLGMCQYYSLLETLFYPCDEF
uniref:Activin_recp domain-containing protein n=1 Tax=Parastrongyloides trichosuri TaxID=131310 RepID=A0A0N5A4B3_PARTI